jgi:hypothetical protein
MTYAHRFFYYGLPLLLFLAFGLYLLPDFEIFYDEIYETVMAHDNVSLFLDYVRFGDVEAPREQIITNLAYYGTFFNLLAYVFQVSLSHTSDILSFESLEIKRYVIFLFSLLGYGALGVAIHQVTRSRYSLWLACGILALMPLYFFNSFHNPKDVPFAVMMTLASLLSAHSIVLTTQNTPTPLNDREIRWLLALGIVIGLCASVRILGIVTYGFWGMTWIICALYNRSFALRRLFLSSAIVGCAAFLVIWVLHPVAYFHPWVWIYDAFTYFSHHPYQSFTFVDGEVVDALHTPWYYLPKWLFVKIPLLWQFLCAAGIVCALTGFRKKDMTIQALIILFLLQLIGIPVAMTIQKTNLYGNGRHFLFVYPAIVFFSAVAITKIAYFSARYKWPALAITVVFAAKIGWDMALLHPYEMAYFIEPVRADVRDKWTYGSDTKGAVRWVSEHTSDDKLLVNTAFGDIDRFVDFYSTRKIQVYNMTQSQEITRPFYFLDLVFYPLEKGHIAENCEIRYKVTRQLGHSELIFSTVRYCS